MYQAWHEFWWLIFPLVGFGFAFWAMWLRHQRHKATIELLRTYASQGKDPPPDLVKTLRNGGDGRPPYKDWQNAVLFGMLTAAFAFMAYVHQGARPNTGLILAALVMTALTVNSVIAALLQRKHDVT